MPRVSDVVRQRVRRGERGVVRILYVGAGVLIGSSVFHFAGHEISVGVMHLFLAGLWSWLGYRAERRAFSVYIENLPENAHAPTDN